MATITLALLTIVSMLLKGTILMDSLIKTINTLLAKRNEIARLQLLVALVEMITGYEDVIRRVVGGAAEREPNQINELVNKLAHGDQDGKPFQSGRDLPVSDQVWASLQEAVKSSPSETLLLNVIGCIRHLDRKADLSLNMDNSPFSAVISPATGKKYFVTVHSRWPWDDRTLRFAVATGSILLQVRVIEGGDKHPLYGLDKQTRQHVEELAKKAQLDTHGENSLNLGFWPVSRHLRFPVEAVGPIENFTGDTKYACFRLLEGDNDWDSLCDIFQNTILPWCEEQNILVLLMPELAVPKKFLKMLQDVLKKNGQKRAMAGEQTWTKPLFIVAGSCHIPCENNGKPFPVSNETVVLDGSNGKPVRLLPSGQQEHEERHIPWTMRKMAPFLLYREKLPSELREMFGFTSEEVRYTQEPGSGGLGKEIPLVFTGFGTMAVAICKDYLEQLPKWQHALFNKSWVDWIFIPAATLETKEFVVQNMAWSKKGCFVLVGNSCWLLENWNHWENIEIAMASIPQRIDKRHWQWGNPGKTDYNDKKYFGVFPDLSNNTCDHDCSCCLWTLNVETDTFRKSQPAGPLTIPCLDTMAN